MFFRFMPDGIYLDARKLGEVELARRMYQIINNRQEYYDFFRWHRYYSFHGTEESAETDDFCVFCASMNDLVQRKEISVYFSLAQWWNGNIQVLKSMEVDSNPNEENMNVIPVTSELISKPNITRNKKKKHFFAGEKPFRQIVSLDKTEKPTTFKEIEERDILVATITLRPFTQTQEKKSTESIMPFNVKGTLDQANGTGSWMKQEFEFEYDYER